MATMDHKKILTAYLSRVREADLAVILETKKRHANAALNGNNAHQIALTIEEGAQIGYAVDHIIDYDLDLIESAIIDAV